MSGEDRRKEIIQILEKSEKPVSGLMLSKKMQVSRQVIVQDMTLLRANGYSIYSTNRGYLVEKKKEAVRVLKVIHSDEDVEKELNTIVDMGGKVQNVFVYHKVYGVVKADMNIKSRMDIRTGKSSLLKNVTSGYHYHTITADSEEILDMIQEKLQELGFLAKLQDYEPVDFWSEKTE